MKKCMSVESLKPAVNLAVDIDGEKTNPLSLITVYPSSPVLYKLCSVCF